jgi:hypothetical protein
VNRNQKFLPLQRQIEIADRRSSGQKLRELDLEIARKNSSNCSPNSTLRKQDKATTRVLTKLFTFELLPQNGKRRKPKGLDVTNYLKTNLNHGY